MSINRTSEKKQKLINKLRASKAKIGDRLTVSEKHFSSFAKDSNKTIIVEVIEVNGNEITVKGSPHSHYSKSKPVTIDESEIIDRDIYTVGENPFKENKFDRIRSVNFTLESILFNLNILDEKKDDDDLFEINGVKVQELNWNPFVYLKDKTKKYYQRDFVWSLSDKQNLIESLYKHIDCGKVLIRKRGFNELKEMRNSGESELAFADIVDGKQRLNTIKEFILGEFPDKRGNYYGDLSYEAQNELVNNHLISYSELPENSLDEEVLYQFLKLNFAGVPQSEEHIHYVNTLYTKF